MVPDMKGLLVFIEMEQKKIFLEKEIQNGWLKKKTHFPASPILNIFWWKFHGLGLGLVELIDAKGIGVASLHAFFVFLGFFWAFVGQPHDHIA